MHNTHLIDEWHLYDLLPLRDAVDVMIEKAAALDKDHGSYQDHGHDEDYLVKVDILELALPDDLVRDLPLQVHEQLQHMVVRLASEHDFTWANTG
jgi:hypothetical protein